MTYFVYLLETERGTIYTGITTDVERRYLEHLNGVNKKGAKYTNANKPVKILYKKEYETKSEAMKEEYRIKHLRREKKLELIANSNAIKSASIKE